MHQTYDIKMSGNSGFTLQASNSTQKHGTDLKLALCKAHSVDTYLEWWDTRTHTRDAVAATVLSCGCSSSNYCSKLLLNTIIIMCIIVLALSSNSNSSSNTRVAAGST